MTDNGRMSTGEKLNLLYSMAGGRYICTVGDDDEIEADYVESLLDAAKKNNGVDVITFHHSYSVNGEHRALTIQRLGTTESQTPGKPELHMRLPSPLCPVRADLAKKFQFPHLRDKEDVAYKGWLKQTLRTDFDIPRVIYHHVWLRENKGERLKLDRLWKGANRG